MTDTLVGIEPDALPADTMLAGRYRVGAVLGRGGGGTVHLAIDASLDREVAVKVYPECHGDADADRSQRTEIGIMSRLHHPGVVTVLDAGTIATATGLRRFMVMELAGGRSLERMLHDGPIAPLRAAEIGVLVANTLSHLHAAGIVHRDVSPANILVDDADGAIAWTVRLTDFGIARSAHDPDPLAGRELVGSAGYLSPEQVRGDETGAPADVYSLGLVLLEAITGQRAFEGTALEAALGRLQRGPQIPEDADVRWAGLLRSMTASDPAARPPLSEVATVMRDIIRSPVPLPPAPVARPRGLWAAVLGA